MRIQSKRNITFISVALCICIIIIAGFYFQGKDERILELKVLNVKDEEDLGAVSTLSVKLTNLGFSSIEPKFSIMWSHIPYYWKVVEGPQLVPARSFAIYKLETDITQAIIPNGETFIVRINDIRSTVFSTSKPTKVNLKDLPLILNSRFEHWLIDYSTKQRKPFQWDLWDDKGSGDTISVSQETVEGRNSLHISVTQDGVKDNHAWAAGHVRQEIEFPTSVIGLWVYPTFTYQGGDNPQNVFGIETHDGTNIIWFIFSDKNEGIYDLPNHRVIVTKAPLNEWSYHEIDISKEYRKLGLSTPKKLDFMAIVGGHQALPGTYKGYFADIVSVQ